jgi:hypothetical protein
MDLKWLCSYETIKFDTVDGDLHKGQYAYDKEKNIYYIRTTPENNSQFSIFYPVDDSGKPTGIEEKIKSLIEVKIKDKEHMYYDEFVLPDGRLYRIPSAETSYKDLAKPAAPPKEKAVTSADITEIKKDDYLWP